MARNIPDAIKPLMLDFESALRHSFPGKVYGVYLYNSIALGAFDPVKSDIDYIVVLNSDFTEPEAVRLKQIHKYLFRRYRYARKLEGMYIPKGEIGKKSAKIKPHLYYCRQKLQQKARHNINAVTWWTLLNNGIGVNSPDIRFLKVRIPPEELVESMRHNLNIYWKSKLERRLIFLTDYWVEFSVLTLCRIVYTLENQKVVSKCEAAKTVRESLPEQYRDVVSEALRIREGSGGKSVFRSVFSRRKAVLAFIRHIVEYY